MIYIILFGILMIMAIFESYIAKGPKFFLRAVAFLILVFVAGTRYETGGDWNVVRSIIQEELVDKGIIVEVWKL